MVIRRNYDYEADRLADRIWIEYYENIYDKESFDNAFNDYLGDGITHSQDTTLRAETYNFIQPKMQRAASIERKMRKEGGMTSGIPRVKHEYSYTAKSKQRIVFAYSQMIQRRSKQVAVYRDRRGRFAKVVGR